MSEYDFSKALMLLDKANEQAKAILEEVYRCTLYEKERPHGEWEYDDGRFICSECEGGVNMPTLMGEPLYKWCPWCGADMRKEGEAE